MIKINRFTALLVGMGTLIYTQQGLSEQNTGVQAPYGQAGNQVIFQRYSNENLQALKGADPQDFRIIYKNDKFVLAQSAGHYYCDGLQLPGDISVKTAKAYGPFLLTKQKSYAYCKPMDFIVDMDKLTVLDFPFFTDEKTVFTVAGKAVKGADVASFVTLTDNQAKDKNNYYFMESEDVVLPYKKSATAFPPCFGWAQIDGTLYYRARPQPQADLASFHCLSFTTAVDKHQFYSYGKPLMAVPANARVPQIKAVSADKVDGVFTDGKYTWFLDIEGAELKGLDPAHTKVEKMNDTALVTDGKTRWQCNYFKTRGEPICHQQASQ